MEIIGILLLLAIVLGLGYIALRCIAFVFSHPLLLAVIVVILALIVFLFLAVS